MGKIANVTLVGSTHGNEYSGIRLIEQWQANSAAVTRDGCHSIVVS